jgi:hypothetical protein
MEIMRRCGQSKPTVWRWQARFAAEGVDGLLRDKTRPPRIKPLPALTIRQVVAKTTTERPSDATHWTSRAMAKAVVRPAWVRSCGWKSCRELVTASEVKRNCGRVTDRGEEAWIETVGRWTRTGYEAVPVRASGQ